jgi:uncharacterized protein (TIGR01244 family)
MMRAVNDGLAIAGTLIESDLPELARRGYRTIIDLRAEDEPAPGGLRPRDELPLAEASGLRYQQIPVGPRNLDVATAKAVERAIAAAEPRVLVHCVSGRRAAFLTAMYLGSVQGWTVGRCLEEVERAGVPCDDAPALRDFLIEYMLTHSCACSSSRTTEGTT